jgi:predicted Rossmann-fold nucleotide-binding protein
MIQVSGEMIGKLHIVNDMHTRKALMAKHADGFIAMPGG